MSYSSSEARRFDNIAVSAGPSPLGAWLIAAWRGLIARGIVAPPISTCEREAAEVRALADRFRKTDPGFAADLMCAANRHEAETD